MWENCASDFFLNYICLFLNYICLYVYFRVVPSIISALFIILFNIVLDDTVREPGEMQCIEPRGYHISCALSYAINWFCYFFSIFFLEIHKISYNNWMVQGWNRAVNLLNLLPTTVLFFKVSHKLLFVFSSSIYSFHF